MKKVLLAAAALALSVVPGMAADMPAKKILKAPPPVVAVAPAWDILFGTAFTTDYVLRGVSQSARKPAVQGYFELDYNVTDWLKLYAGLWGSSLYTGFADAEFDITAGGRFSYGNFGLDLGYIYYSYPDGVVNGFGSFSEVYAKPSYKFNDWLTVGGVLDYGTNFNNKVTLTPPWIGNAVAYYYSANAVITLPWHPLPDVNLSLNPEIGQQVYGSGPRANLGVLTYTYYDIGLDIAWKAATLDLRYWATNTKLANNAVCAVNGHPGMDACASRFVATLKFDTSFSALK
jgi:uncharacterized protein (TIGR02001 family)